MKKLNNNGFEISTMIGFMIGLVVALIIVTIISVHYGIGRI